MLATIIAAVLCCHLSGLVRATSGASIARASIVLTGATAVRATAHDGAFETQAPAGTYRLRISADGFVTTVVNDVRIVEGSRIEAALDPLSADTPREIGRVSVDGRLVLSRGTVPQTTITRADMERLGSTHVLDALETIPSLTVARPGGGPRSAVAVAALRGPDPSETLVTVDGQVLNDTNTGDFDFSQLPVGPFSRIEVSEGLGLEDHLSANTIGGEIDLRTLAPTHAPQRRAQIAIGSFGTTALSAEATGTYKKLGYAVSGTSANSGGYVRDFPASFANPDSAQPAALAKLGSSMRAQSALVDLEWNASDRVNFRARYLTTANLRDVSAAENAPVDSANDVAGGTFVGPGPATFAKGLRAFLLSARGPLGAGELSASYASSGQTTTYDGGSSTPYDTFANDGLSTFTLQYERAAANYSYAFGGYTRGESLDAGTAFANDVQRERSIAFSARAAFEVAPRLRLMASAFQTHYSTFGSSLDGRFGLNYDVDRASVFRASVGTGFRAPLLAEKYETPLAVLVATLPGSVDANCVAANGNAHEKPEHVTAYEIGYGRALDAITTADVSLYRTNLRDPIENAYPLGSMCPGAGPAVVGQVVPTNIGNVIYQGAAFRFARLGRTLSLRAAYGLNVAHPTSLPATVSNPTSGGNLIDNVQFQGIPIQTGTLGIGWRGRGAHVDLETVYKGRNNELSDGPFALLNGAVGYTYGRSDITLGLRNITSAESGRFTRLGLGLAYPSPFAPGGALPTDRISLEPVAANLLLTLR